MDHEHRNDIDDANLIDEFISDNTEDLLQICHDLTACNSINPPGSTVETAQVIQNFLKMELSLNSFFGCKQTKPGFNNRFSEIRKTLNFQWTYGYC